MKKSTSVIAIIVAFILGFYVSYQVIVSTMQIRGYTDHSIDITILGETHTY